MGSLITNQGLPPLISRDSSSFSNPKAEDDDEDEHEKNENKIPVTSSITG
jgi:hypothetical protein